MIPNSPDIKSTKDVKKYLLGRITHQLGGELYIQTLAKELRNRGQFTQEHQYKFLKSELRKHLNFYLSARK